MTENNMPTAMAPSLTKVILATLIAFVVAAIILVVAVLPAEYGKDPLGTGKALGLMDMAKAAEKPAVPAAVAEATIMPTLDPAEKNSKWGASPLMNNAILSQQKGFNYDAREITLKPGEGMEVKYSLKKGGGLVYSWTATGKLLYDFHGQPDVKPEGKSSDYFYSYSRDDKVGKDEFHGTLVAPDNGIHGWFWENPGPGEVTLKLTAAGYFDWVFQNRDEKQKALQVIPLSSLPSHPKLPDEDLPH
jgi:hypothetical protein